MGNENGLRGLSRLECPTGTGCVSLQAAEIISNFLSINVLTKF